MPQTQQNKGEQVEVTMQLNVADEIYIGCISNDDFVNWRTGKVKGAMKLDIKSSEPLWINVKRIIWIQRKSK